MIFLLFILTSITAIIIFSLIAILLKYIIPEAGGGFQFLALNFITLFFFYVVIHIFYSLFTQSIPDPSSYQILLIFFASIFGFLGSVTYIKGLEQGKASVGGVVLSSRVFIVVPLGYFLIGEEYPIFIYIFILIAFIGSVLVSWQEGLSIIEIITFQSSGMRYFLGTAIFWSLQNLIIRELNNTVFILTLLTIRGVFYLIFTVVGYLTLIKTNKITHILLPKGYMPKLFLYGLLSVAAQLGLDYAIGENLSITETIAVFEGALTFIFTYLFAIFVSNEVLSEHVKGRVLLIRFVGVVLSVVGTVATILNI